MHCQLGLGLYMSGLIFNGWKELLDDGTSVILGVFKGPIVKASLGRLIQGALVKALGLSGFVQLLGFQQGVF